MNLEKSFNKIREFLIERYENNLAALLIFGSANIGHFREGKSDIDTIILLKHQNELNFENEIKFLLGALKSERFATQYFNTLEGIKNYIKERTSWSTYITIAGKDGSRVIYSTPEFEKTKKWLSNHPPIKEALGKYLKEKDEYELNGYFKKRKSFDLTKALMAHLRRKLQVINYYKTGNLIFGYNACLENSDLQEKEKQELRRIYQQYKNEESLNEKEIQDYNSFAKNLTKEILRKYLG